jgi:hypothetical protein
VFQVILSGLAIGRASTPLPFADAFRLNATVPAEGFQIERRERVKLGIVERLTARKPAQLTPRP